MSNPQHQIVNARTVIRSGVIIDGKEFVVAVGYAKTGEFGYFICWEQQHHDNNSKIIYEYNGVISFKKKENEQTIHEVLGDFRFFLTDSGYDTRKLAR